MLQWLLDAREQGRGPFPAAPPGVSLRAMASGSVLSRLGFVVALLVGSASLAEEPPPTPGVEAPEVPPPAEASRSSVQWQLIVGGQASLDGYSPTGHQGLLLGAGWEFPLLRFRFQFLSGLPDNLYGDRTHVRLEQYTFGFWLDAAVLRTRRVRWGVGLGAGALVFARSSFPLFRGVEPANPRFIPALLTGPDTSVRWRLSRLFAVEGTAAMDVVFGRPILGYVDDSGFKPLHRGWPVQPRLTVALLVLP